MITFAKNPDTIAGATEIKGIDQKREFPVSFSCLIPNGYNNHISNPMVSSSYDKDS